MAFKVYQDVPIPKKNESYNFEDLEVSEMLFVPLEDADIADPSKKQAKVSAAASSWGKRNGGRKFQTQVVQVEGTLGVGVWRVA